MSNYLGAMLVGAVGGLLLYLNYKDSAGARTATTRETAGTGGVPVATVKPAITYAEGAPEKRISQTPAKPVSAADVSFWGSGGGALVPWKGSASALSTYENPPAYPVRPEYAMYTDTRRIKSFR